VLDLSYTGMLKPWWTLVVQHIGLDGYLA